MALVSEEVSAAAAEVGSHHIAEEVSTAAEEDIHRIAEEVSAAEGRHHIAAAKGQGIVAQDPEAVRTAEDLEDPGRMAEDPEDRNVARGL